ncbi:uncharacterized protein LOC134180554 [Corticium candelabrum]|uniref:uncharacterized protein LOC134180554 n=1 Tax=Corticium candelabrum TaxID=121492 RepID=UPI002E254D57|nr:uncharacterized protein LOC134180554 [Corticium candelabrum]
MISALVLLGIFLAANDARADLFDLGGGFDHDGDAFGDSLGNLIGDATQTAVKNYKGLSKDLKDALGNSKKLLSLSDKDFASIPLDVLSDLKDSVLSQFDAKRLEALIPNISTASSSVVNKFLHRIPDEAFTGNLEKLSKLRLSVGQYYAFGKKALKSFGKDVSRWTSDQIRSLGNMNFGLSMSDLSKLPTTNFKDTISYLNGLEDGNGGKFTKSQVFGMMKSAKKAWGRVSTWSSDKLKSMASLSNRIPVQDIAQLDPTNLASVAKEWADRWEYGTEPSLKLGKSEVIEKLKASWGDVSSWTKKNLENLKPLLEGMSVKDVRSLKSSQFAMSMGAFLKDDLDWSWQHLHAMAAKGKENMSDFSQLDIKAIKEARRFFPGLLVSDLKKLNGAYLRDALPQVAECFRGVQDSFSQVEVLLRKVSSNSSKIPDDRSRWDEDVLDDLRCLSRGLLCGEFNNINDKELKDSKVSKLDATWSVPQLWQLVKKFQPINNLGDLKKLVYGVNTDDLLKLSFSQMDLENIDKDGYDKMTRPQLLALLDRLKVGRSDLSDESKWGWQTIKNFGRVLFALSPQEVSSLPAESYEDIVQAASTAKGLTEGQAKAIWMTVRKRMNITSSAQFVNVTNKDIAVLGPLVMHMGLKDLYQLDATACMQAVEQMGETDELSIRTSSERRAALAQFAINCLKKEDPNLTSLSTDHIFLLGRLLANLDSSALAMLGKSAVSESLSFIGSLARSANPAEVQTLANLIKKYWNVGDLTADQLVKFGHTLKGFSSSDISGMNKQAIADAMEDIGIGSDVKLSSDQSAAVLAKIKATWGQNVGQWGADRVLRLGRLVSSLSSADLSSLLPDQFDDLVDYLGQEDDLSDEQISALVDVAKKTWGDFRNYTTSQFRRLGYLAVGLGLDRSQIAMLTGENLGCSDTGYALGRLSKWTKTQSKEFVKFVKRTIFSSDVSSWSEFELTVLGNITSGLNVSELESLKAATLSRGLSVLGNVVGFSDDQQSAIVTKLKGSAALGRVIQWKRSQIYEAGNLLKGLPTDDIRSLSADQLGAIDQSKLVQLGSNFFSSMTSDQLSSLEPQQARAVSAAYSSELSAEQTTALAQATDDDLSLGDEVPTPKPSASLGGFASMLTVLLFLIGPVMI